MSEKERLSGCGVTGRCKEECGGIADRLKQVFAEESAFATEMRGGHITECIDRINAIIGGDEATMQNCPSSCAATSENVAERCPLEAMAYDLTYHYLDWFFRERERVTAEEQCGGSDRQMIGCAWERFEAVAEAIMPGVVIDELESYIQEREAALGRMVAEIDARHQVETDESDEIDGNDCLPTSGENQPLQIFDDEDLGTDDEQHRAFIAELMRISSGEEDRISMGGRETVDWIKEGF